jgi:RimJ/RimL family protein N-acetyltransferase
VTAEAHAAWERPYLAAPGSCLFRLRTLDGDRMIGAIALADVQWVHRTAMFGIGIGIGEREYRGKGYGSDAIRLILRYAFEELNLYRVWTHTISFNQAAMRCFERAGFKKEGVGRGVIEREGRRFDLVYYGMLRDEWRDVVG